MPYVKPVSRLHAEFAKQSGRVRVRCIDIQIGRTLWTQWKYPSAGNIWHEYENILESTLVGERWEWKAIPADVSAFRYEILIWEGDLKDEPEDRPY